jgi:hypothetical protein
MPRYQQGHKNFPKQTLAGTQTIWEMNGGGAIYLVVEGLKRTNVKPLNYSQVNTVQQGPDESPSAFLQHLKGAIQKHSTGDPESLWGKFSSRINF